MKTQKLLVTGASGSVGQELLSQLSQNVDYELFVFDLNNSRTRKFYEKFKGKIKFIEGDLGLSSDISKIPENIDVVIHLAAIIPPLADDNPDLAKKVNVHGTQLLVNYLQSKSPNCMFLYSSSISVYGDRVNSPDIYVTDKVKVSPGDLYGETKLEAEEIVKNSGLRWTVFRLAAIMKNHKISKLMFNMPLETKFEICTPEDTARAFVNALDKFESVEHKIFNLGGGKACCTTYRNFLENSFRIYGLGKLNFPKYAFAEHNYHCGYFADGDDLNNLLHFRNDTLETYYKRTQAGVSTIIKWLTFILSPIIKWYLLAQSEPYKAYKMQNIEQLKHFFESESVIKILKKKKIAWILGIFIMLIIINISNVSAQTVRLKVSHIKSNIGQLCIAIFENQHQFANEKPLHSVVVAKKINKYGEMTIILPLKEGTYGISVLDDVNMDNTMNYHLGTIPKEGFGFSDYYHNGLLKPTYNDFKFKLKANETKEVKVKLRYML